MSKLGQLVKIKTGKLDANASSEKGKYPFFTCAVEPLRIDTYSYDCECVLVAGNGDLNVKYYNGKFDAYQRTYIIESNNKSILSVPYLYFFLEKYVEKLRELSIGGVIKYIKLGNLTEANIPVPTLSVQQDIVLTLDKVTRIIDLCKAVIEKSDLLVKARFIEMFGKIDKIQTISNVCSIITDGTHQSPQFTQSGIPFLLVSNITTDEITYNTEKFISEDTYNKLYKRTPIEIGDIVLSTVGSYGHPAVVKSDKKFLFQRHIAYLKPIKGIINSTYLHSAILSEKVQKQIEDRVKGVAQKTLNLSEIRKIKVPVPPIVLQNQFAEFANQTDKTKSKVKQLLEKAETLKKALMQKYFG